MCSYFFILCDVNDDDCGVCGQVQFDCGNAKTWETFKILSCPDYRTYTDRCHYDSPIIGVECNETECPRRKLRPNTHDLVFD
jgi:hypothetical protein